MKVNELVYSILDRLKLVSDDAIINEEHILFLCKKYRSFLIKKEQEVSISVRNQPYGLNVLLFPPSVKVSYLVPQSKYHSPLNLTVVVDYNDINMSSNKVNIKLGEVSGAYSNVVIGADSVNYVIERF